MGRRLDEKGEPLFFCSRTPPRTIRELSLWPLILCTVSVSTQILLSRGVEAQSSMLQTYLDG